MLVVSKAQGGTSDPSVPNSPLAPALTSRRLELLVASAEAARGGWSVGIGVNVLVKQLA